MPDIIGCVFFVEGACEKKLIETLKNTSRIIPGKVRLFNCVQEDLSVSHLLSIREGNIVFVFDTDVRNTSYLFGNIGMVKKICPKVKLLFPVQVENFEDEIVRSADVRKSSELTSSKSTKVFLALKTIHPYLENITLTSGICGGRVFPLHSDRLFPIMERTLSSLAEVSLSLN